MATDADSKREWLATVYQTAIADTRWAKEQGWRATQWSLAMFGGLLALYKYPFQRAPVWPFAIMSLLLAMLFTYYIINLHGFAVKSRSRNDEIKRSMPEPVREILGGRDADPNHVKFLIAQIVVIWLAFALCSAGLSWIHGNPT